MDADLQALHEVNKLWHEVEQIKRQLNDLHRDIEQVRSDNRSVRDQCQELEGIILTNDMKKRTSPHTVCTTMPKIAAAAPPQNACSDKPMTPVHNPPTQTRPKAKYLDLRLCPDYWKLQGIVDDDQIKAKITAFTSSEEFKQIVVEDSKRRALDAERMAQELRREFGNHRGVLLVGYDLKEGSELAHDIFLHAWKLESAAHVTKSSPTQKGPFVGTVFYDFVGYQVIFIPVLDAVHDVVQARIAPLLASGNAYVVALADKRGSRLDSSFAIIKDKHTNSQPYVPPNFAKYLDQLSHCQDKKNVLLVGADLKTATEAAQVLFGLWRVPDATQDHIPNKLYKHIDIAGMVPESEFSYDIDENFYLSVVQPCAIFVQEMAALPDQEEKVLREQMQTGTHRVVAIASHAECKLASFFTVHHLLDPSVPAPSPNRREILRERYADVMDKRAIMLVGYPLKEATDLAGELLDAMAGAGCLPRIPPSPTSTYPQLSIRTGGPRQVFVRDLNKINSNESAFLHAVLSDASSSVVAIADYPGTRFDQYFHILTCPPRPNMPLTNDGRIALVNRLYDNHIQNTEAETEDIRLFLEEDYDYDGLESKVYSYLERCFGMAFEDTTKENFKRMAKTLPFKLDPGRGKPKTYSSRIAIKWWLVRKFMP